ncbi:MAG: hypothetical protein U9Q81_00345 [Pseudomonadota bacterium]|nr:hypothetical protein [Pseudomonadota bacterium]
MHILRLLTLSIVAAATSIAILAAIYASSALAETYGKPEAKTIAVCIDGIKGPSTRGGFEGCFEPTALEFRSARTPVPGGASPASTLLAMAVGIDQVEVFRRGLSDNASQAAEVRVCIIDGANICFEEPLEIVWVCITTGLLAGSECPEVESDGPSAIVGLASATRR